MGGDASRFYIDGDSWIREQKLYPIQRGEMPALYEAIEQINYMRSIEHLTDEADCILRGTVVDTRESRVPFSDGRPSYGMLHVGLRIDKVLKGTTNDGSIEIAMINKGGYVPFWRTPLVKMSKGEEWILMLKSNEESGYYPFAGPNGMFRIEGDVLFKGEHRKRSMEYSPTALERMVRRRVAGEDEDEQEMPHNN